MSGRPYLSPGRIGSLDLPNRLVRTATSETMSTADGEATDGHVRLYGDLAAGGAGLVVTGHIYVEPRGQYAPLQTGLYDDRLIAGLKRVVDAVHARGGRIFAELSHAGSQSVMPHVTPVAPSVIPNAIFAREPVEMTGTDIDEVVGAFGAAAGRAMAAGFDGIHIHGGNGYLIAEFSSPHANRRDDEWGGDAERRGRFVHAVFDAVRAAVGPDVPVTARIGMADAVADGLELAESVARVRSLAAKGLDGVEVTYGVMNSYKENIRPYAGVRRLQALRDGLVHRIAAPEVPEAYYRPFARALKEAGLAIPVILIGGIRSTTTMADILESGDADFLAFARPFIREPGFPAELASGREGHLDCVSCNICLAHEGRDPLRCWRRSWGLLAYHAYCRFWRDRAAS